MQNITTIHHGLFLTELEDQLHQDNKFLETPCSLLSVAIWLSDQKKNIWRNQNFKQDSLLIEERPHGGIFSIFWRTIKSS